LLVGLASAAVLAFPVIYFMFGMTVAPFVAPVYRAGVAGLTIPPFSVMLPVELVRARCFCSERSGSFVFGAARDGRRP
jgi:hypothetical protein